MLDCDIDFLFGAKDNESWKYWAILSGQNLKYFELLLKHLKMCNVKNTNKNDLV